MYGDIIFNEIMNDTRKNLVRAGQELLKDCKNNCPVDTGKLKASGKIEVKQDEVDVVFDTDYAVFVHELPGRTGNGYKWVERTIDQNLNKYIDIVSGNK